MKKDPKAENLIEEITVKDKNYLFLGAKEIIKENLNKELLAEDEGGDSGMAGGGGLGSDNASLGTVASEYQNSMGGMGGQNYGATQGNELFNIFLQPFLDIFLTGLWGLEKLTQWSKSFLSMLIKGAISTVTPFIRTDYTEVWQKHHKRMEGVDQKYQEVLKRNEEAMKMTDVWGMFFLMDPTAFIGLNVLSKGTTGIKNIFDLFFGGMPTAAWSKLSGTSQAIVDKIHQLSDPTAFIRTRHSYSPFDMKEAVENPAIKASPAKELTEKELNDPKFKEEIGKLLSASPQFKEMQNQVINNMLLPLHNIVQSKTLVQLNQNMNNRLAATIKEFEDDKKSTPAEKEVIESGILTKIKVKAVEDFKEEVKKHGSKNKKFAALLISKIDSELVPAINK